MRTDVFPVQMDSPSVELRKAAKTALKVPKRHSGPHASPQSSPSACNGGDTQDLAIRSLTVNNGGRILSRCVQQAGQNGGNANGNKVQLMKNRETRCMFLKGLP